MTRLNSIQMESTQPMRPAKRLDNVPMYVFAAHAARLRKLASEGLDIIRLDIGEPDAPPPAFIIDELCRTAHDPKKHGYAGYGGTPELKKAIADYYQRRFGVTLDPGPETLPLIGSKEGLANIALAWLDPGDRRRARAVDVDFLSQQPHRRDRADELLRGGS